MSRREWIRQNRRALERIVGRALSHVPATASCFCHRNGTDHYHEAPKLTLSDLSEWCDNDEGLYNAMRSRSPLE